MVKKGGFLKIINLYSQLSIFWISSISIWCAAMFITYDTKSQRRILNEWIIDYLKNFWHHKSSFAIHGWNAKDIWCSDSRLWICPKKLGCWRNVSSKTSHLSLHEVLSPFWKFHIYSIPSGPSMFSTCGGSYPPRGWSWPKSCIMARTSDYVSEGLAWLLVRRYQPC